jgi:thiamine kinase-like enzyme
LKSGIVYTDLHYGNFVYNNKTLLIIDYDSVILTSSYEEATKIWCNNIKTKCFFEGKKLFLIDTLTHQKYKDILIDIYPHTI